MDYKPDLSPEEKLDVVSQKVVNLSETDNLYYAFIANHVNASEYTKEIFEILLKLHKDGYVTSNNNSGLGNYASNFDGRLFIDNGGYTEEKKRRIDNDAIAAQNETRIIRNERLLIQGTWFAGFGALFLLSWQVFLWINPAYSDFPYILFGIVRKTIHRL
jgi:hypothetical protein